MIFEVGSISEQVGGQQNIINTIYNMESDTESGQVGEQVLELYNKVLAFCREPKSAKEIKEYLNIKSRSYISRKIINPLILKGKLEYENKKHIKASNQRYVTVRDNKK